MAHAQKADFVFQRNGRVHLNRRGASVQSTAGSRGVRISGQRLYRPCSDVQCKSAGYPLHSYLSLSLLLPASPCAIRFWTRYTYSLYRTLGGPQGQSGQVGKISRFNNTSLISRNCVFGWVSVFRRNFLPPFTGPSTILGLCTKLHGAVHLNSKGKSVPLQASSDPEGSRKLRLPEFVTMAQDGGKVVSVTHRPPLPPGNTTDTHFF